MRHDRGYRCPERVLGCRSRLRWRRSRGWSSAIVNGVAYRKLAPPDSGPLDPWRHSLPRRLGRWALASPAMRQIGGRIWLGAAIGFIAGTVAGLVLAVALHQHAYAFWGFVLGGTIFGTILGGFVGGMSSLESPAPGQEPGDRRS